MPKVKICGVRRPEDITFVNKYLPEYIGFVFAKSKRRITAEYAHVLAAGLDRRIKKVGVFVNEDLGEVIRIVKACSLDAVQIHGDEQPEYVLNLKRELQNKRGLYENSTEVWKAVRIKNTDSLAALKSYIADAYVLDAWVEGSYGGAGACFDWNIAAQAREYGKIVLAGGLNEANAKKAVEAVKPYALDVSSGVETEGVKDEAKIRAFINTVRSY
ncbi:MAG: phosphoribosylanthranilate isomerase [Clostridia bacterium]|nr:phosphoribosylanthranilate isomerase [Clostridia bacterium]